MKGLSPERALIFFGDGSGSPLDLMYASQRAASLAVSHSRGSACCFAFAATQMRAWYFSPTQMTPA